MSTPLAWNNLIHNKVRTVAAVAGVMFAVVLIFLQLGFLGATVQTASRVYDVLDFDVLIRSQRTRRLAETPPFPRSRLDLAASVAGVREVHPLWIGFRSWRVPQGKNAGYGRPLLVVGVKPGAPVFLPAELRSKTALLGAAEFALVDRRSRAEFGPRNGKEFGDEDIGSETEVGGHRIRLVGHYALGASFDADGSIVVSDEGFARLSPGWTSEMTGLGLVKLESPEMDSAAVAVRLNRVLPADVQAFSRNDIIALDRRMWLWEMSIGLIFLMGVAVAVAVGIVIVYQILSSDVLAHLPEYATLLAMGYRNRFLGRVVLFQSVIVALMGFLPGLLAAEGLYRLTTSITNIPMDMTVVRILAVLVLSVGMCILSGLAALWKLRGADPADLY
jgi:putative ABC transport system permease protein